MCYCAVTSAVKIRSVDRPIKDLVSAAARWQAGDWTARAESERGIAELEELTKAFDAMAERVAARESALRRSQQHLIRAKRLAAIGSWETDCRTGKLEWSEEYYRILGVSPDTFQPTLRRSVPSLEFRATRADGAIRTLYREGEPLFDAGGSPIGYFGSVRDVTEAQETEQQLRRSREHLVKPSASLQPAVSSWTSTPIASSGPMRPIAFLASAETAG